jgi:hypothetical protein
MTTNLLRSQNPCAQVTPDQGITDQFLAVAGCTDPTPEDIACANAIILSAAIHVCKFLNKNPTAFDEVEKSFASAESLIRCACSLGWQDDPDSIERSIGVTRLN